MCWAWRGGTGSEAAVARRSLSRAPTPTRAPPPPFRRPPPPPSQGACAAGLGAAAGLAAERACRGVLWRGGCARLLCMCVHVLRGGWSAAAGEAARVCSCATPPSHSLQPSTRLPPPHTHLSPPPTHPPTPTTSQPHTRHHQPGQPVCGVAAQGHRRPQPPWAGVMGGVDARWVGGRAGGGMVGRRQLQQGGRASCGGPGLAAMRCRPSPSLSPQPPLTPHPPTHPARSPSAWAPSARGRGARRRRARARRPRWR